MLGVLLIAGLASVPPDVDHLVPDESLFATYGELGYYVEVSRHLVPGIHRDIQMVCLPSFERESAVYVERPNPWRPEGPFVVLAVAQRQIWDAYWVSVPQRPGSNRLERVPATTVEVHVDRMKAPIDEDTVTLLAKLWDAALYEVRFPRLDPRKARIGLDGETCHFANSVTGYGYLAGQTWSPREGSRLAALIAVGRKLADYVRAPTDKRAVALDEVRKSARETLARFAPEGASP